jgi:signal peptide peptidase SppA
MKAHPVLSAVAPLFADGYALLSQQHGRALMARAIELSHAGAEPRTAPAPAAAAAEAGEPIETEAAGVGGEGGAAVIPIIGILTKYPIPLEGWDEMLGLCPSTLIIEKIQAAIADSMVESIVLVIDSPGGFVNGTVELADVICQANEVKPITAVVTGLCCSGAYWAASQCRSIVARPESQVGNIGVYSVLMDDSKFWEQLGVSFELRATGPYKGLGADGKITDALREETDRSIDGVYNLFVAAVSAGRGIDPDLTRNLADGRAYLGAQAKQLKLIDGVATSPPLAAALTSTPGPKEKSMTTLPTNDPSAASAAAAPTNGGDENDPKSVFDKTASSANDHRDQARAAMDACHAMDESEPDDDTKSSAKACVSALESCADESSRAADALSEKFDLDEDPDGGDENDQARGRTKPQVFRAKDYAIFGDAGYRMYYQGKSFAQAAKDHIARLEAENRDLKKKLAAMPRGNDPATFQAEPPTAKTAGTVAGDVAAAAAKRDRTYADGGTFGDGRGLDRFAAGIKMPGTSGSN